ncbi:MAG TPA: hypothetical protein VKZ58_07790 [Longimicrobiales bacterium]|nr:hypothetical protein [Longimicrobiales bacterium]
MRNGIGAALLAAAFILQAGSPLHAQAGRADLRYVAPLPETVIFTSVDSTRTKLSNALMGELVSTGAVQATSELRFAPAADGVTVTAILKRMRGETSSPMGTMPLDSEERPPFDVTIGPKGPDPETIAGTVFQVSQPGADPLDAMGSALAVSGLIIVPGRELRLGEEWTDTIRYSPKFEGLEGFAMEMTMVYRGTYAADTVVDGRTLNVLRIVGEGTATGNGTMQGLEVSQNLKLSTQETVLWDSGRHIPVSRVATSETVIESSAPQAGVSMKAEVSSRSVTRAEPSR